MNTTRRILALIALALYFAPGNGPSGARQL